MGWWTRSSLINIPDYIPTGTTRMRVTMSYGGFKLPCDDNFRGEVEDYTIIITNCQNVSDGGTIGEDEVLCGGNDDPASISNLSLPAGNNAIWNMQVFPNPAQEQVSIRWNELPANATLALFNPLGQVVLTQPLNEGQTDIQLDLTDSRFKAGTYLISIYSNEHSITKRLVIIK